MSNIAIKDNFYNNIKDILQTARDKTYKQVNFVMVEAYWNIGKQIVQEEQNGQHRAKYGLALIKELSKRLTSEFGKGFSQQSLRNMRQFYNCFPIHSTLWSELSWSHYKLLIRLKSKEARDYYMEESVKSNWSVRALERQIGTHYYERIISSRDKQIVEQEAKEKTKDLQLTPKDIIKDPYVLEFLDLKDNKSFRESELESALKRGKLTHQDIGQMDMYINMFDDLEKSKDDNPTIGIILCSDKDNTVVKYSSIKDNLFVSKYQMYLPSEEELKAELERDIFELEQGFIDE